MNPPAKLRLEVWSPLPPLSSGIADYVCEQLETLEQGFDLTLVVEDPSQIDPSLRARHRVVPKEASDPATLRVYHVGNSPLHGFIYREALRTRGVVVLHEWNLHELVLGFGVRSNDFTEYRRQMRRQHGERGAVAAETVASALGGLHWTSTFALNVDLLESALAVVCLSPTTARRVSARKPGGPVLQLDHHAFLPSRTRSRAQARWLLGLPEKARIVIAPGLGTTAKGLGAARDAVASLRGQMDDLILLRVGGGAESKKPPDFERALGHVELETLADALVAADVVLALRFPSRGETSGVLMRAFAAGRAAIVSSGSVADEDLPAGTVARVNPGPFEALELEAVLGFLLRDEPARSRLERLASALAAERQVESLTRTLGRFLLTVADQRKTIETALEARAASATFVSSLVRGYLEGAAGSLGLASLPADVYQKLSGLGVG